MHHARDALRRAEAGLGDAGGVGVVEHVDVGRRPVALVKHSSTSVPIQLGSTLAAERATPCWITAGKVAPTGPCQPASDTSFATTSATASGVDGRGVRMRLRLVTSWPVVVSTIAPLIPVPPMSMPNAWYRSRRRRRVASVARLVMAMTIAPCGAMAE